MNASLGVRVFLYPFRDPDTDEPLANGTITTTLANTATLVATFADAALTTPNTNPGTLDSNGDIVAFFSPLNATTSGVAYDVVVKDSLGVVKYTFEDVIVPIPTAGGNATTFVSGAGDATTLTIAGGSITPTRNVHLVSPEGGAADNLDTIAITGLPDGARLTISNTNGSAAITVRNNQGNIFTSDGLSVVLSTTAQRLSLIRYGANFFVDNAAATAITQGNNMASGRLTLVSATPVTVTDVSSTSVFYTPYTGNVIDLYDGVSAWSRLTFAELSLSLAAGGANGLMDIFAFNNAGTVTLSLVTWSTNSTRATALVLQDGVLVKSGDTRYRYLGTVGTNASSVAQDTLVDRLLWNYYNRVVRPVLRNESTATWAYSTATYRQANAAAANQIQTVTGVVEDAMTLDIYSRATLTAATDDAAVSLGFDSTTTPTAGVLGQANSTSNIGTAAWRLSAHYRHYTQLGRHLYIWLERGAATGTTTWQGASGQFQAGIHGTVLC